MKELIEDYNYNELRADKMYEERVSPVVLVKSCKHVANRRFTLGGVLYLRCDDCGAVSRRN